MLHQALIDQGADAQEDRDRQIADLTRRLDIAEQERAALEARMEAFLRAQVAAPPKRNGRSGSSRVSSPSS